MKRISSLVMLFVLGVLTSSAHGNLIKNGSFESGELVPNKNGDMLLHAGATDLTGWIVINDLTWIDLDNPWKLSASDGNRFVDFTEYRAKELGGVSQSIQTTVGEVYEITFDLGSSTQWKVPVSITVIAGVESAIFTSTNLTELDIWESFSFKFTATSSNTLIIFLGLTGKGYTGLDNVSVKGAGTK